MPKVEGDEVEYLYVPGYGPWYDEAPIDPEYCAFTATTTKSRYQTMFNVPLHLVQALGVEQVAQALASDVDEFMNTRLTGPDSSPELGVEIDPEQIRAALEAGIPRT